MSSGWRNVATPRVSPPRRAGGAGPREKPAALALANVPPIDPGLGPRPGAVRVEPDPAHAGRFVMRVLAEDPHAGAIPWAGPVARSVADPIALGVFEDAADLRVPLAHRHPLIGGAT